MENDRCSMCEQRLQTLREYESIIDEKAERIATLSYEVEQLKQKLKKYQLREAATFYCYIQTSNLSTTVEGIPDDTR